MCYSWAVWVQVVRKPSVAQAVTTGPAAAASSMWGSDPYTALLAAVARHEAKDARGSTWQRASHQR